jgi:hypothetical protein
MEIKQFTVKDLRQAIVENSLWQTRDIPITKDRAISQVNNPRAKDDDVILLVAYTGDEVAGYLGILPDEINVGSETSRFGWTTTWWTNPNQKDSKAGTILLLKAYDLYRPNFGSIEYSETAEKVLEASRRFNLGGFHGVKVYSRMDSDLLIRRFPSLEMFLPVIRILTSLVNVFTNVRLNIWKAVNPVPDRIRLEYLSEVDSQTAQFINQHQKNALSTKNAEVINWIMRYPWVVPAPLVTEQRHRYFFSQKAKRFSFMAVKVFDGWDRMVGFILLQVKDRQLSAPYIFISPGYESDVMSVIYHHIVDLDISMFYTFNQSILELLGKTRFPSIYRKDNIMCWSLTKALGEIDLANYAVQDGDGDNAFT